MSLLVQGNVDELGGTVWSVHVHPVEVSVLLVVLQLWVPRGESLKYLWLDQHC